MADRLFSRIYHELADEFPEVYDSPDLAGYCRLLVAADQAWPSQARWSGHVTQKSLARLVESGLISLDGSRYRVKGLDKERARRSQSASHAARIRHGTADRNAPRTPTRYANGTADRNAEAMPSREEKSREEVVLPLRGVEGVRDLAGESTR